MSSISEIRPEDLETFPHQLSQAIDGLNNNNRQKILLVLYTEPKLSFTQIMEHTRIDDSLLSSHLRKLKDSMLIEQFYEHIIGQEDYSFYKITKYGRRILNNLFNVFYVIKRRRKIEIYMKITDEETAISPDTYFDENEKTKELNDTAEGIKKKIDEFIMEV